MVKKLYEGKGKCPVCGSETKIEAFLYPLQYLEGSVVMFVEKCSNCGFVDRTVFSVDEKLEEKRFVYDEKTSNTLIYIPPYARIEVPDMGIVLEMREGFGGRITTLEGIIRMIEEDAKVAIEDKVKGKEIILKNVKVLSHV